MSPMSTQPGRGVSVGDLAPRAVIGLAVVVCAGLFLLFAYLTIEGITSGAPATLALGVAVGVGLVLLLQAIALRYPGPSDRP